MRSILIIAAILSVLALWLLPKLQVRNLTTPSHEKFASENEARKTIAQILGGLFFFTTLYFTWQSYELSKQEAISGRFAKAIEQLAHSSYEVRLGAIYSLESISRDSPEHYWLAMEVLTAFLRARTGWTANDSLSQRAPQCQQPRLPVSVEIELAGGACTCDALHSAYLTRASDPSPVGPEIQAVISVLGRRKQEFEMKWQRLDLRKANLRNADMSKLHLEKAILAGANISGADLRGAFLSQADLSETYAYQTLFGGAHMEGATLREMKGNEANFYQAQLSNADLSDTCLDHAEMGEAVLAKARLDGTVMLRAAALWDADMREVSTEFVNMEGAELAGADFAGADMVGIYFLTCQQMKVAKFTGAKRRPAQPRC